MVHDEEQNIREYDLIVVGSGSGNSLVNHQWRNKKAAIIDGGVFGGTCLNKGCIPTKMFAYPATTARHGLDLDKLGVSMERKSARWREIRDRIFNRIDGYSKSGREFREGLDTVDLYTEYATFRDPHTLVTASGEVLRGREVVIAAGSRSVRPDIPGIDLPGVHTSDTVMRLDDLPGRVVILGGGFIAAEFAGIFSGLGAQVTQVNRSERLLKDHDPAVSERFAQVAARQWDLRMNTTIDAIAESDGGLAVTLRGEEGLTTVTADIVLVATGRVSNVDSLEAEAAGLDVKNGVLSVDEYQRVLSGGEPVPGLWALGDVSSEIQLKHLANAQERTVQHNIHHPDDLRRTDQRYVPHAVFTNPQIAAVGLTEPQAREKAESEGFEISVKVQDFGDVAYGWAMEDEDGFVKLIARKDTGELLGAHLIGTESSMLIQPLIQAMSFGLTAHEMARGQFWIHPALTEVVENALLGLKVPGNRA